MHPRIHTHTHAYTHMHPRIHTHTHAYTHMHPRIHTHTHAYTHMHACMYDVCPSLQLIELGCIYEKLLPVRMYVCMYVCMYACVYICVHVRVSARVYAWVHAGRGSSARVVAPTRRVCPYPQTEEIGLKIMTYAKISNKFSQECPYISNTRFQTPYQTRFQTHFLSLSVGVPKNLKDFQLSTRHPHSNENPGKLDDLEIQIF